MCNTSPHLRRVLEPRVPWQIPTIPAGAHLTEPSGRTCSACQRQLDDLVYVQPSGAASEQVRTGPVACRKVHPVRKAPDDAPGLTRHKTSPNSTTTVVEYDHATRETLAEAGDHR